MVPAGPGPDFIPQGWPAGCPCGRCSATWSRSGCRAIPRDCQCRAGCRPDIVRGPRRRNGGWVGMARMDAPHLTVAVYPDPADDRAADDIRDLLLERGARLGGDGHFVEHGRRMRVQRVPHPQRTDSQPVEIVMSAGALGDPGYSRRQMLASAHYVTGLLVAVVERTRPLYGGIGVEDVFPLPVELRRGVHTQGFVTDPLF